MNKTELIKPVAEAAGISQTQAKAAIEKVDKDARVVVFKRISLND